MHVDPILPSTFVTLGDVMSYSSQKNSEKLTLNLTLYKTELCARYIQNGILLIQLDYTKIEL